MSEVILGPDVTVELIRSMRKVGYFPAPDYILNLAQTVGAIWPDVEVAQNGRYEFEIFSPPLSVEFSLLKSDVELVDLDESLVGQRRRRERQDALFSLLDLDPDTQTIVDLGRVTTRIVSPLEVDARGLSSWNEYIHQIDAGEVVLVDLNSKLRNYVLDLESQVGYRIGFERITQFSKGEIAVPELANKKVMLVNFLLLTVDGEPIAVSQDATGTSYYLDTEGRVPPGEFETMMQRSLERAFGGQHVSVSDSKEDKIKNADLLERNKRFNSTDYPLFFEDLVRLEVIGEKVDRCKRSLPRAKKISTNGASDE